MRSKQKLIVGRERAACWRTGSSSDNSLTVSKVPREHCTLTNNRLAAIQNEAIAAVQAATESVTGVKQNKSNVHYQAVVKKQGHQELSRTIIH